MHFLLSSSTTAAAGHLISLSKTLTAHKSWILVPAMSMTFHSHAFSGNPIKLRTPKPTDPFSSSSALQTLKNIVSGRTDLNLPLSPNFKILPFRKGRPLAGSSGRPDPNWRLGWLDFGDCRVLLEDCNQKLGDDSFVYLGSKDEEGEDRSAVVYWAIDVSECGDGLVEALGARQLCFVELRTLMVASDWADSHAMAELAVAGHARALLEWHGVSRFCGFCGSQNVPTDAGKRKQCLNESCKKKVYPRVDPVVIMLVIDKENDRALLSRQSRFVPRMWSCLAGFMEPGESLEEAVRRETLEETGIEVGEVVYHSSQPWPVGPSSMPCQLMIGFFAYAKSLDIEVDKEELEDAQWHKREDVKKALTYAEYHKAQKTTAAKVDQMCNGGTEKEPNSSTTLNAESDKIAPMFVPGPYAIAHHLIFSWAHNGKMNVDETQPTQQAAASLPKL